MSAADAGLRRISPVWLLRPLRRYGAEMASSEFGAARVVEADGIGVRLTSPDKPMFEGCSKGDLLDYYLAVGTPMLDQVGDRPTAMERWPEGVFDGSEHFFHKNLPKSVPDYVAGVDVKLNSNRVATMLRPTSRASIGWAVQMGTITFHAWSVTASDVEHPDQLRVDLDQSPGTSFADVVSMARLCREVLTELSMPAYVKTSGGDGLHVYVPIEPTHTFIDVRHAVIAVGRQMERRRPDLLTLSWWKEERGERVFLDYNQNARDRLIASAYSVRPHPSAPVSMPLSWYVLDGVRPDDFTVRTVPSILSDGWINPWADMRANAVSLAPALDLWDHDVEAGLGDLPYPPEFPKMPGEPKRVQPSRDTDRKR